MQPEEVLDFWFGEIKHGIPVSDHSALWWSGTDNIDQNIKTLFEQTVIKASAGKIDHWKEKPRSFLALIILLDQFPLNIYRKTRKAFDFEKHAVSLCLEGLHKGIDKQLTFIERVFFYLPLEHSEDIEHQQRCVALFQKLKNEAPKSLASQAANYLDFAEEHKAIIEQFSRFPFRNDVLGRESTQEEILYLEGDGKRYGQ